MSLNASGDFSCELLPGKNRSQVAIAELYVFFMSSWSSSQSAISICGKVSSAMDSIFMIRILSLCIDNRSATNAQDVAHSDDHIESYYCTQSPLTDFFANTKRKLQKIR